jgi:hypothetical protein
MTPHKVIPERVSPGQEWSNHADAHRTRTLRQPDVHRRGATISAMRMLRSLNRWLLAASAICVAAAAALAVWLFASGSPAPAPQARQYLNVTACLLTGPQGVTPGSPAAPVWASMETASVQSHVMISYLPEIPPENVKVMLSTLAQRRCGVIITAGAPADAVLSAAEANPGQRFLLVTDTTAGPAPANTTVVSSAAAASRAGSAVRALAATA